MLYSSVYFGDWLQIVFFPFVFPSSVESATPLWPAIISSNDDEVRVEADDDIDDGYAITYGDISDVDDDEEMVIQLWIRLFTKTL